MTTALKSYEPRTARAVLDDHGIRFLELEVLADWYATGDRRVEGDRRRHRLLAAAGQLEADVVKAIGQIGVTRVNLDLVTAELRVLAEQARRAGTRISIESSPAFDLQTPTQALQWSSRQIIPPPACTWTTGRSRGLASTSTTCSACPPMDRRR